MGTVSDDGSLIQSNPGIGVIKAGWHCGSQPGGSGCCEGGKEKTCSYCENATGSCPTQCELVPDRIAEVQKPGNCQTELCRGSRDDNTDVPEDDCGTCKDGKPSIDETKPLPDDKQKPDDCKLLMCGGNNKPQDETPELQKKEPCKLCSNGKKKNVPDKTTCGDGTPKKACYTCKGGKCGNHCKAKKGVEKATKSIPFLKKLGDDVAAGINRVPFLRADIKRWLVSGTIETGEECCKDCSKSSVAVEYTKVGGSIETGLNITSGIPGASYVEDFDKDVGFLKFQAKITAGFTAQAKDVKVTATGEQKNSICEKGKCVTLSAGANADLMFRLELSGSGAVKNCDTERVRARAVARGWENRVINCSDILVLGTENYAGVGTSSKIEAISYVGDESCKKEGCIKGSYSPLKAKASTEFKIVVGGIIEQTVVKNIEIDMFEGGSFGDC